MAAAAAGVPSGSMELLDTGFDEQVAE